MRERLSRIKKTFVNGSVVIEIQWGDKNGECETRSSRFRHFEMCSLQYSCRHLSVIVCVLLGDTGQTRLSHVHGEERRGAEGQHD